MKAVSNKKKNIKIMNALYAEPIRYSVKLFSPYHIVNTMNIEVVMSVIWTPIINGEVYLMNNYSVTHLNMKIKSSTTL